MSDGEMRSGGERPSGPGGGHVPDLSDVLLEGERAVFVARGRVRASWIPRLARWFVVVTDRRLICLRDRKDPARQQIHIALPRIEQAYQRGMLGGKVVVHTRRARLRIAGLGRAAGGELVGWLLAGSRAPGAEAALARPTGGLARVLGAGEAALERVEQMEAELDRLKEQVGFLEELLQNRAPERRAGAAPEAEGGAGGVRSLTTASAPRDVARGAPATRQ